jgi:glycosyltransferase involved in cell wall biosynthesis
MLRPYRLAYLVSHPIQYQAPLLKCIASDPAFDLSVYFLSAFSTCEYRDPGFAADITWDVPLLEGYKHEFLPAIGRRDRLTRLRPFARGLSKRLLRGQFDALWLHDYAHQAHLRALLIAKLLGIPILLRTESHCGSHPRSRARIAAKAVLMRALFGLVDAFLAIGTANLRYYLSYGVRPERVFMMPYAVDNLFFSEGAERAHPAREELRNALGFAPARPVILYASKITANKRPSDLLTAYIRLGAEGREPHPYLLFVGDGPQRRELEERARALGWSSVRFVGFVGQHELPRYYDLCDLFVLPSEFEPWGLVVNEAMNAAKPVIASDRVGAAVDLVRDGRNGFIFPCGDIEALRSRLARLVVDAQLMKTMGAESKRLIARWNFAADLAGLKRALAAVSLGESRSRPAAESQSAKAT